MADPAKLASLSVPQLKELAKKYNLKTTGLKKQLIIDAILREFTNQKKLCFVNKVLTSKISKIPRRFRAPTPSCCTSLVHLVAPGARYAVHEPTGIVFDTTVPNFPVAVAIKRHGMSSIEQLTKKDIYTCKEFNFPFRFPVNLNDSTSVFDTKLPLHDRVAQLLKIVETDAVDELGEEDEVID